MEDKIGFESCKECFKILADIDFGLCKTTSEVCPPIPKDMEICDIKDFLQDGIDKLDKVEKEDNMVNHPPHYNNHPAGIECIEVTEHMSFNIGNAVKYLWRVDDKANPYQDLNKAIWYIQREILKRKGKDEEKI